jgi:hypothetical protein
MRTLQDHAFNPREIPLLTTRLNDEVDSEPSFEISDTIAEKDVVALKPSSRSIPVVAIDVSSIRIGETEAGPIAAIRGAVVWRSLEGYKYLRCGPLLFHLNNLSERSLDKPVLRVAQQERQFSFFEERILVRLRTLLERSIQTAICRAFDRSIILFDGSLTAGTPDNPARNLSSVLDVARERGNAIIAFSKSTKLKLNGRSITSMAENLKAPSLIDIDSQIATLFPTTPVRLLGHVYLVKLAHPGFIFRVDVDRGLTHEGSIRAIEELLGSDLVDQGYPETLRLAHIFSTFTANEVVAMQRHVSANYGLRIVPRLSLRRSLFGPFGSTGEIA